MVEVSVLHPGPALKIASHLNAVALVDLSALGAFKMVRSTVALLFIVSSEISPSSKPAHPHLHSVTEILFAVHLLPYQQNYRHPKMLL